MAKLFELSKAYQMLQDTDEISEEEISTSLDNVKELFNVKASNLAKVILSIQSDTKAYDDEITRLTARRQVAQNKIKSLKEYLLRNMVAINADKIQIDTVAISLRTSPPSIEVENEEIIPENYWRIVRSVDKQTILNEFKTSNTIPPGVNVITDNKYVSIR